MGPNSAQTFFWVGGDWLGVLQDGFGPKMCLKQSELLLQAASQDIRCFLRHLKNAHPRLFVLQRNITSSFHHTSLTLFYNVSQVLFGFDLLSSLLLAVTSATSRNCNITSRDPVGGRLQAKPF